MIWHVAALVLPLAGPFGSFGQAPLSVALVYWWLVVGISLFLAQAVILLAERILPDRSYWVQHALILPAFVCAFVPVLFVLTRVFLGEDATDTMSVPHKALVVAIVAGAIAVLRRVLSLRRAPDAPVAELAPESIAPDAPETADAVAPEPSLPRLTQRLAPDLRAPLLRLSVNDHYVEVYTRAGHATVLIRFSDALAEVDCVPGLQVHRSHWVADDAVAAIEQDADRRLWIVLTRDGRVPVSRTYRAAVLARWGDEARSNGTGRGGPPR